MSTTVSEINALTERVLELVRDRERLDWLCSHDASIMRGGVIERHKGNDPDAYYIEWIEKESGDIVTQLTRHADYREAIDAAMAPPSPTTERSE